MATAILRALLERGLLPASQVTVSDPLEACRQGAARLGARAVDSNLEAARGADVLLLAVKPGVVPAVLREIRDHLQPAQLVLSIAAGVTLAQIEELLPPGAPAIRIMP